jgi:glutathione S-transferase
MMQRRQVLNNGSGLPPHESGNHKYTVPAIKHVPSDTYIMDSGPIAEFLEKTYPQPAILPGDSEAVQEIASRSRASVGRAFRASIVPREIKILSPRSQEYFRRTREAAIGQPLEDLLAKEEQGWETVQGDLKAVSDLILTTKGDKPYLLGSQPCATDVFLGGALQSTRTIDEGVFERVAQYPGYKAVYDAMVPFMEKRD